MYINFVYAYRIQDTVMVLIRSDSVSVCDKVTISGTYPGNIHYFMDPGKAHLFIDYSSPDQLCNEIFKPWLASVILEDSIHNEVEIFINRESVISVPIINYPAPYNFSI